MIRLGDAFQPGPWNLGRWSRPIGIVATIWVVFITIVFLLPQVTPINAANFNYAPVAVGVVLHHHPAGVARQAPGRFL